MSRTIKFPSTSRQTKVGGGGKLDYGTPITTTTPVGPAVPATFAGAAQVTATGALTAAGTIAGAGPVAPTLTWQSNDTTYDPVFQISGILEGDTVQLDVDNNADFSSLYGTDTNLVDINEAADGLLDFPAIPTLGYSTTYHARSRIQRGGVWSDWSTVQSKAMAAQPVTPSTFDPANAMADEYLTLSPDKLTLTIPGTDVGQPMGSRMTNARTGKRFLPFKINNGPFRPFWGVCDTDRAWGNGDTTFGDYSTPGNGRKGSTADAINAQIWPSGASMTSDIGAGEWVAVAFETIVGGSDTGKVKVWYNYEGAWRGDPVAGTGNELTAVMSAVYGFMAAHNQFSATVYPNATAAAAASCPIALPSGFTFYDG